MLLGPRLRPVYSHTNAKSRCISGATRSYAIALVFIAGRFVLGVTGWEALGVEIAQAIIWSCLALSVVLADVAINWKELRSALTVPARSSVSPPLTAPRFHFLVVFANPICLRCGSGGVMSCLIASNTTLNRASYFRSISLSLRANSALEASI